MFNPVEYAILFLTKAMDNGRDNRMRTKRIQGVFMTLALLAGAVLFSRFGLEVHASGTPILIHTAADFNREIVDGAAGTYKLTADITLTGTWTPVENFSGTLDGNGYVIRGLTVTADNAGLFESLTTGAEIKNLGVDGAAVNGNLTAGIISADAPASVVSYCYAVNSTVIINGLEPTAGFELLGSAAFDADTCYYGTGDAGTLNAALPADSLVRWVESSTAGRPKLKVYTAPAGSAGNYTLSSAADLANLANLVNDGISDYASGTYTLTQSISGINMTAIGTAANPFTGIFNGAGYVLSGAFNKNVDGDAGLFGSVQGATIRQVGLTGTVTGDRYTGGLIGQVLSGGTTTLTRSYTAATVRGTSAASSYAGGLAGYAYGDLTIASCYSTGTAGTASYAGGGVGGWSAGTTLTIRNSYTTASKMLGSLSGGTLTLTNSYCTSYESGGAATKTLAQMQRGTFVNDLNTGNSDNGSGTAVYGTIVGKTPVLIGVGDGIGTSAPLQVTKTTLSNGDLKVYDSLNREIASGEYVAKDTLLRLTAVPATGYDVTSIKADGVPLTFSGSSASVQIRANMEVSAEFAQYSTYTIKVVKTVGGTISPGGDSITVRAGAKQSFTITPDTDCRIQSVTYTGSGLTVDDDTYTTGPITRNETLTVKFVSKADGVKDITVTTGGVVVTAKALENVADLISGNIGNTIKVDMSKSTVVDKYTLQELEGNDVNLLLDMKDYSWRINGNSVSPYINTSVNLGMTTNASSIPEGSIKKFGAFEDKTQLDLEYTGSFPFVGYLTLKAPGKNTPGKYATLFYYNEATQVFESVGYQRVADDGTVTYRFTHASKYVLVVADRALSVQDLGVGAPAADVLKPLTMKRSDLLLASVLFAAVAGGGLILILVLRRAK